MIVFFASFHFSQGSIKNRSKVFFLYVFKIAGNNEIIFFLKVEAEEYEFDYCLSSIEFLPNIQHLSKILRYNMPSQAYGKTYCSTT